MEKKYLHEQRFKNTNHLDIIDTNIIYIGGGLGFPNTGFLSRSTDGGVTWSFLVDTLQQGWSESKFFTTNLCYFWLSYSDDPVFNYTRLCNFTTADICTTFTGWGYGAIYSDNEIFYVPYYGVLAKEQSKDSVYQFFSGDGVKVVEFTTTEIRNAWVLGDSSRLFQRVDIPTSIERGYKSLGKIDPEDPLIESHPNPFNSSTTIKIKFQSSFVKGKFFISDVLGRMVALLYEGIAEKGEHRIVWDGKDRNGMQVASGAYYVVVLSEDKVKTKAIIYLK